MSAISSIYCVTTAGHSAGRAALDVKTINDHVVGATRSERRVSSLVRNNFCGMRYLRNYRYVAGGCVVVAAFGNSNFFLIYTRNYHHAVAGLSNGSAVGYGFECLDFGKSIVGVTAVAATYRLRRQNTKCTSRATWWRQETTPVWSRQNRWGKVRREDDSYRRKDNDNGSGGAVS